VKAPRIPEEAARAWTKIPLFVLPLILLVVLASSTSDDLPSLSCADHHPIRIGGERERLVTALPVMTESWLGPQLGEAITQRTAS
jgi:hypothetical protein